MSLIFIGDGKYKCTGCNWELSQYTNINDWCIVQFNQQGWRFFNGIVPNAQEVVGRIVRSPSDRKLIWCKEHYDAIEINIIIYHNSELMIKFINKYNKFLKSDDQISQR